MSRHFQTLHNVANWPKGSVVDESVFPVQSLDRMIELGAICETTADITIELPAADVGEMTDDELTKENAKLKAQNAEAPGRIASLQKLANELEADNAKIKKELDATKTELESTKAVLVIAQDNKPIDNSPKPNKK